MENLRWRNAFLMTKGYMNVFFGKIKTSPESGYFYLQIIVHQFVDRCDVACCRKNIQGLLDNIVQKINLSRTRRRKAIY